MQFITVSGWDEVVNALAQRLSDELGKGRVLWLLSGGSNVEASVKVMNQLSEAASRNLTLMPVDERYGPPGHADSNWAQLMSAGFNARSAKALPVLSDGLDFEENTAHYNDLAEQALADHEMVIAQLGIGPDGHIAGILPGSAACQETKAAVVGYEAPPLRRITLSFTALRRIKTAYVGAFGDNKLAALQRLRSETLALAVQPAQILKSLPETFVFSDQLGAA